MSQYVTLFMPVLAAVMNVTNKSGCSAPVLTIALTDDKQNKNNFTGSATSPTLALLGQHTHLILLQMIINCCTQIY